MPTFLWKVKSRIETFLSTSGPFNNLIDSVMNNLSDEEMFFVEIGANDGITGDPLYKYVQKGKWSGVYIEPQKTVFEKLVHNLKNISNLYFENIAITESYQEVALYVPKGEMHQLPTLMGSISRDSGVLEEFEDSHLEIQKVEGKPFTFIIDKYDLAKKKKLFLLIDVEGYESKIIFSIDFSKVSPGYIFFEHEHMKYSTHRRINEYLANLGYKVYLDKRDTLAYKEV